ncbi:TIGR04283 family arsenosugar biosynthesis glycosyltransferase [Hyphococcus sp.]|uniref:TIGR04283 family arsenosugar biosynthesis glycosyltransferase n=1 Tax=Hyphococcus sp. TaxID=2038636 RepID=UPI00208890B1|nr:MAG: glycosyl transferase [Marinicaulis sp.]
MISIVIPTLNAEARLAQCLDALVTSALDGLVKEVIIVDGGSTDVTLPMADSFGTRILTAPPGRGGQLAAGAKAARGEWLLFLHADTVLEEGWSNEAAEFIEGNLYAAAVFTFAFDATGIAQRLVAWGVMQRTRWVKAPYGDQGLLISKKVYDEIGGFADMPLFEDVDIIRRLIRIKGPHALHILSSKAVTSAERYERDGYARRVLRNFVLLMRYQLGVSPEELAKAYR